MSKFKVTDRVMKLVQNLIEEGYSGSVQLTNRYPTGAAAYLEGNFSLELTGFCKESLYISENEGGSIYFVGRYSALIVFNDTFNRLPVVEDIVDLAWSKFLDYESRGYGMPSDFYNLFIKYGKIREKSVKSVVVERI